MDVVQMYRSEKQLINLYYNETEDDIFGSEISKRKMIDWSINGAFSNYIVIHVDNRSYLKSQLLLPQLWCIYQPQKWWENELDALSYTP